MSIAKDGDGSLRPWGLIALASVSGLVLYALTFVGLRLQPNKDMRRLVFLCAYAAVAALALTFQLAEADPAAVVSLCVVYYLLMLFHICTVGLDSPSALAIANGFDSRLWTWLAGRQKPLSSDLLISTPAGEVRVRLCVPSRTGVSTKPYSDLPQKAGAGGKGWPLAVVLIPDAPVFVEHQEDAAVTLCHGLGLPVIMMDMPGFGLSRPVPSYDHSVPSAVQAIHSVLEYVGAQKALLHASCVNGYYVLGYAQEHPDRVAGVVVGNTPSLHALKHWAEVVVQRFMYWPLLGQLAMRLVPKQVAARWFSYAVPRDVPNRRDVVAEWTATSHGCLDKSACWCFAGVLQNVYFDGDESAFAGVPATVPVTVLWGSGDRSHTDAGTDPKSLIASVTHAKLHVVPPHPEKGPQSGGAGHAPGLERPDVLLALFKEMMVAGGGGAVGGGGKGAKKD